MVLKRIYILTVIMLWAMGSYFYLQEKYNPFTVEVYLEESISYEVVEDIAINNRTAHHVINYITSYEDGKLVMTTGQDGMFQSINLLHGYFIAGESKKVMVIGDKVANKHFRTDNVVGRKLEILGEDHLIIGVIQDSWDTYIAYQEELVDKKWDKVLFKYQPDNPDHINIRVRDVNQALSAYEVAYADMIIYGERMQDYINYMVLSIIGILLILATNPYRKLKKEVKALRCEYQQKKQVLEIPKYIVHYKKDFLKVGLLGLGGILLLISIYHLLQLVSIPQTLLPDNLFSPASYRRTLENIYNLWVQRMHRGFSNILIDTVVIHLAMLLYFAIQSFLWIYYDRSKNPIWRDERTDD